VTDSVIQYLLEDRIAEIRENPGWLENSISNVSVKCLPGWREDLKIYVVSYNL